jgi:deoxyadenosine/deoxycytidine kinase
MKAPRRKTQIAIVGPCASGKSTLAEGLSSNGYNARQIVQEHSYVPDMWKIITRPRVLIYLDADYQTCSTRGKLRWTLAEYEQQVQRLAQAREGCHICIRTDDLEREEVLERALEKLRILSKSWVQQPKQ